MIPLYSKTQHISCISTAKNMRIPPFAEAIIPAISLTKFNNQSALLETLPSNLPPWLSGLAILELQCSESLAGLFERAWVRLPNWYGRAWESGPRPWAVRITPVPQHVESGFQHVMRLKNLGQVQRVRPYPLKTVTGHHTKTVLGRLGVVRAAGVDNRWEGPWHVGICQRNQPA